MLGGKILGRLVGTGGVSYGKPADGPAGPGPGQAAAEGTTAGREAAIRATADCLALLEIVAAALEADPVHPRLALDPAAIRRAVAAARAGG